MSIEIYATNVYDKAHEKSLHKIKETFHFSTIERVEQYRSEMSQVASSIHQVKCEIHFKLIEKPETWNTR